jgi:hypothetical protein
MSKRLTRIVVLVSLAVLLLAPPGLLGCTRSPVFVVVDVGFLGDLTGPAGFEEVPTLRGIDDYLRKVEEEDLIPELSRIHVIAYDTKGEFNRVRSGCAWLKDRGAIVVVMSVASIQAQMIHEFEEDGIPCLSWDPARADVALETVDGSVWLTAFPYWTHNVPFVAECKETLLKYRPDEAELYMKNAGYITGYGMGMVVTDALRRAVEEEGAEHVDGPALRAVIESPQNVEFREPGEWLKELEQEELDQVREAQPSGPVPEVNAEE